MNLFRRQKTDKWNWVCRWNWIASILLIVELLALITVHFNLDRSTVIGLLSVILAVIFPVFVEKVQRPSLRIVGAIKEKTLWKDGAFWVVKLQVYHEPLPDTYEYLCAYHWLERRSATRCRGTIRFMTLDGKPATEMVPSVAPSFSYLQSKRTSEPAFSVPGSTFGSNAPHYGGTADLYQIGKLITTMSGEVTPGTIIASEKPREIPQVQVALRPSLESRELEAMAIRWAGSTQPSEPVAIIKIDGKDGTTHHYITEVDIAPNEENAIDIVIQYQNDTLCYGWNNEVYFLPSPKASRWRLSPNKYLVEVKFYYGDRFLQETFLFHNTGSPDDLVFRPLSLHDQLRLSSSIETAL